MAHGLTRLSNATVLVLLGATCGRPGAIDDSDGPLTDLPSPDLPASTGCGDGIPTAGELCFEQQLTDVPAALLQYGQFNEDAYIDLAFSVPEPEGQRVNIWLSDGQFGLAPAAEVPTKVEGAVVTTWLAANLDADARSDLVLIQILDGEARINSYINEGSLNFAAPITSDLMDVGAPWNSVVVFDSGANKPVDLLVEPYEHSDVLYVIANAGDGGFSDSGITVPKHPGCSHTTSAPIPAFGAFTGGVVFIPGECDEVDVDVSGLSIVLSQMGGVIHSELIPAHGPGPSSAGVGDFDDDGDLELLVWDRVQSNFGLYQGNFVGGFELELTMALDEICASCELPTEEFGMKIGAGNFDGDAAMDLALAFADQLHFGLNPLTDSPSWSSWKDPPTPLTQLLIVDLNDDDFAEVVLASSTEQVTYVLANRP